MSWKPIQFLRSGRWFASLLVALSAASGAISTALADDFVVRRPIDRRFPQGQFCALPIEIQFIAPGPTVRVVFEAYRFIFDPGDGQLHWTRQYLDNVALADAATYDANFGPAQVGSNSEICYSGAPTPFFYFSNPGLPVALLELFDTDPTPRGWDMAHGAYFSNGHSAPRDPADDNSDTGGSLGMGLDSGTPAAGDLATTEITINGLAVGQSYKLSAWWDVNYVVFGSTDPLLVIAVLAPSGTPVAKKSWGSLKSSYR